MADAFDPLEPSPYKVLNISQDASTQQIKAAHRKLVLQYHPDKVQDESEKAAKTERFQEIQHAYEILQDDKRRSRWDRRAAEKDRQMEERRMPRRPSAYTPSAYTSSRPSHGPAFEDRGGVRYEERVPRYARTSEENVFEASFGSGPSKSSKKWSESHEESSSRRTSGKGPDTRSRYKDMDDDLYAKTQEKRRKEDTRNQREEAQKRRDKAKRQDKEASFSRRTRVEEYDDTDDYDDRHHSSKSDSKSKYKPADPYRYKDDAPRRSTRRNDDRGEDAELERKISMQQEYLSKSRVETETRRTGRNRADSYSSRTQLPTPPPTPRDRDGGRRSSGDDGRKSSARTRRPSPARRSTHKNIEIVDPTPSKKAGYAKEYPERSMPREKTMPSRSRTTYDHDEPEFTKPAFRRAETMPIHHMSSARDPRRAPQMDPRMFQVESSDETPSSSDTDSEVETTKHNRPTSAKRPGPLPAQMRTSYKVSADRELPQVVTAEPESYEDRSRENSPKSMPRRAATERYASATTTRSPLVQSQTFTERLSSRRTESRSGPQTPSLRATQSARDHPHLWGAIDNDDSSPRLSSSPKSYADSRIRSGRDLNSHSRRGSDDVRADYSPRSSRMDSRRQFSSREIPAR